MMPEEIEEILNRAINLLRAHDPHPIETFSYLLKLLLLKKFSDRCEIETSSGKNKNDSLTSEEISLWLQLKKANQDIVEEILHFFTVVEDIDSRYKNILTSSDANWWEKIGNTALDNLIHVLTVLNFFEKGLDRSNLIADVFEKVLEKSASRMYRASIGSAMTPKKVARLLVDLVNPDENTQICDPACRSGEILTECIRNLEKQKKDPSKVKLFGQEKDNTLLSIARMILLLRGANNFEVSSRDVIQSPQLTCNGELVLFDSVITNPPFGIRNWKPPYWRDLYGRFEYGEPPNSSADFAFIQHILATLKDNGKAAIIVPRGVLFREGAEGVIRRNIVECNLIESIIELPSGIFYDSPISTAIVIFNKKNGRHQGKILFINAAYCIKTGLKRPFPLDDDIHKIVSSYSDFSEEVGYSRIVSHEEIAEHGYDLQVSQYTSPQSLEIDLDVSGKLERIRELERSRTELECRMNERLKALGIEI